MAERVRRTNAEIDHIVMAELEKLVIKSGFGNVLVTELMANARWDQNILAYVFFSRSLNLITH